MNFIYPENMSYDTLPPCGHAELCGGCSYQGVPYAQQLANKLGEAQRRFEDCGFDPSIVAGIKATPLQYAYRNRMDYTFGNEYKDGPTVLGLHRKKSFMSVTECGRCEIVHPDFNKILSSTSAFCEERGYAHYNKKTHRGLLRNLILRRGVRTGELLVILVTSSDGSFDDAAFLEMLLGIGLEEKLAGVLHTYNDSLADAVIPERTELLYGKDSYSETVLGLSFKVGAFSFFQTNVDAAERLYSDALSLIPGIENKTVYDLYCGTGTISQAMALRARKVIGVEIVEEAVEAARVNAALNGLSNCSFIAADVLKALDGIEEKPDVIVVDPPRAGIHPKALQKILAYGVDRILYISCNPKTMADDLRAARLSSYRADSVMLYDNFPFTRHTEAVALLRRCPDAAVAADGDEAGKPAEQGR